MMLSPSIGTTLSPIPSDDWSESDSSSSNSSYADEDDGHVHKSLSGHSTSSGKESSTGGYGSGEQERADEKEIEKIIRKETQDVVLWREIVTGMLVITAVLVTVTTYVYLSRSELDDFGTSFHKLATTLIVSSAHRISTLLDSSEGFSDIITTLSGNAHWPDVTIPDFTIHGERVRVISGADAVWLAPVVTIDDKSTWEIYSAANAPFPDLLQPTIWYDASNNTNVSSATANSELEIRPSEGSGPFAPIWQMVPFLTSMQNDTVNPQNYDLMSSQAFQNVSKVVHSLRGTAVSEVVALPVIFQFERAVDPPQETFTDPVIQREVELGLELVEEGVLEPGQAGPLPDQFTDPHSLIVVPVYGSQVASETNISSSVVSYLTLFLDWRILFSNALSHGQFGVSVVLQDSCGQAYTWWVNGPQAVYQGQGDLHDTFYDDYEEKYEFNIYPNKTAAAEAGACSYSMKVYPSRLLRETFKTHQPKLFTLAMSIIFFVMAFAFFAYDKFVQRRNNKVISAAARTNAIVSSLFPDKFRDRLFDEEKGGKDVAKKSGQSPDAMPGSFAAANLYPMDNSGLLYQTKPIADLFPETTVLFADLVGFTAWSSVREPSQVFVLLETLYRAFDILANRRRIFKVETVGDCYVAVAGLPEPRKDHAVAMSKFANEIMRKTHELVKKLEVILGPDTGDLTVRIGIHSGPVTAGVLRGERSRFQLFGDTMNTAARMESTGMKNKVQLSQETADILTSFGKAHWIKPRETKVLAKGKGEMQTYWLEMKHTSLPSSKNSGNSVRSGSSTVGQSQDDVSSHSAQQDKEQIEKENGLSEKTLRLIHWNVDVLCRLLQHIVARREASLEPPPASSPMLNIPDGHTSLEELKEIISLPEFDAAVVKRQRDPSEIELNETVKKQVYDFVTNIAYLYHDNPFHNFEHASHVTMSVTKLLSRIVAPIDFMEHLENEEKVSKENFKQKASTLHDHTYGITSDPLTQFACVFSALIHDVDHTGVPNTQLILENSMIADLYKGKSVAEQNSIDISWELLMSPAFPDLRSTIFATENELKRFRELVVNAVLATDIMDKDLKALRNMRWEKAFSEEALLDKTDTDRDAINRKATIVIEHLIQASDVAHTMQHWHIYRKWNERLFQEMFVAYKNGRAKTDPSEFWYKGEMGFFDFYIIPLAKKLKNCGVFGVSSDEYLQYAMKNRQEWEIRGQEVVAEMRDTLHRRFENA